MVANDGHPFPLFLLLILYNPLIIGSLQLELMDSAAMYPLSISSPQGKTSSVKSDSSSGSDHTRYAPFSSSIHRVHLPLIFSFFLPTVSADIYLSLLSLSLSSLVSKTILGETEEYYLTQVTIPLPSTHPIHPSVSIPPPLTFSPFPFFSCCQLSERGGDDFVRQRHIYLGLYLEWPRRRRGGDQTLSLCSFTSHYQLFWRVNSLLSTQSISTISCPFSRFSRYIQLDSEYWDDCESLGTEFLSRRQRKSVREEGESGSWSPLFYSTTSSSSSSSPMDIPDVLAQTEGGCTVVIDGCSLR